MNSRAASVLAAALLTLAPASGRAALSPYLQNLETLVASDPAALGNDGWLVYGNVFTPGLVYLYGYGPFPAPNAGTAFCAIDAGQGGAEQGLQQLSIYNDYNNADHANGNLVEANVYREQTVAAGDAGTTWVFDFDAKLGNLVAPSTAVAFIKTLDPAQGYALTNFITLDTTILPTTWGHYSLSIDVDASLVGQLMQFGFASTTTNYVASGVYYDNLRWDEQPSTDVPGAGPNGLALHPAAPNPFAGATRIAYSVARAGAADLGVFDIAGRRVATLVHGDIQPGRHDVRWDGRLSDGRLAPAGVYRCVLQTASGRQTRSIVLTR